MKRHLISPPRRAVSLAEESALVQGRDHLRGCASARSTTANGDGIGDFRGPRRASSTTCRTWASRRSGCCRSIRRRCGTTATTSPTTPTSTRTAARWPTSTRLLEEAHRRGLRVITELVLNHTSDQHPWFQRARRAPAGSARARLLRLERLAGALPRRADHLQGLRDLELGLGSAAQAPTTGTASTRHQPDLNFDNPAVHEALLEVVDFWFGKGVDGLRLDAVPYLYEREGTNCENLPDTHGFLKKLRAHVDGKFQDRMLLAEANQWPEDAAAYFGAGDECHMNFHFPIMPRMFMAIHMEDRFPIVDILAQTPPIPETCQWALFLRNHDELTLEMVTDEERDYMYRAYAHASGDADQPRHPPAAGAAGRQRPAQDRAAERPALLAAGDAGPLLRRRDRDGRQRLPRRPQRRAHAHAVERRPQRRLLARQPAAAHPADHHRPRVPLRGDQRRGAAEQPQLAALVDQAAHRAAQAVPGLRPRHRWSSSARPTTRVLAFMRAVRATRRSWWWPTCRASRSTSSSTLAKWKGMRPIELFGHTRFPPIGDLPYLLTLGGHAFHWFSIEAPPSTAAADLAATYQPPSITCASTESLLVGEDRVLLEEALPASSTRGTGSAGARFASRAWPSRSRSRWAAPPCSWRASSTPTATPSAT